MSRPEPLQKVDWSSAGMGKAGPEAELKQVRVVFLIMDWIRAYIDQNWK